jgi:hypothetical protein
MDQQRSVTLLLSKALYRILNSHLSGQPRKCMFVENPPLTVQRTIHNPALKETITFLQTAAQTGWCDL